MAGFFLLATDVVDSERFSDFLADKITLAGVRNLLSLSEIRLHFVSYMETNHEINNLL